MSSVLVNAFKMVRGNAPLPEILAEIAEVIGHNSALKVAHRYRGTKLRVPKYANRRPDSHPIIRLIGRDHAVKLGAFLSGDTINVPVGPFNQSVEQLYQFSKLRKNGHSVERAAHTVKIHGRTGTRWEALIRDGQITNNDLAAYGKLIGDDWS